MRGEGKERGMHAPDMGFQKGMGMPVYIRQTSTIQSRLQPSMRCIRRNATLSSFGHSVTCRRRCLHM